MPFVGDFRQHHSTYRYTHYIMYREFLATDIEGVKSVGAVGAVFEEVFFALGEFFADLSLRKPLRLWQITRINTTYFSLFSCCW